MAWWADLTIADGGAVEVTGSLYHGQDSYSTLAMLRSGTVSVAGDFDTGYGGELLIELGDGDYQTPAIDIE